MEDHLEDSALLVAGQTSEQAAVAATQIAEQEPAERTARRIARPPGGTANRGSPSLGVPRLSPHGPAAGAATEPPAQHAAATTKAASASRIA